MQCAVYVDFDGTIAPDEPTDALFDKFADPAWREIEKDWQEGRASSRDCMERQVAFEGDARADRSLPRARRDRSDVSRVCALVRAAWRAVIVVSDGLDRVVGHVLRAAGLELPYFANRLVKGGERWSLQFPYYRDDSARRWAAASAHTDAKALAPWWRCLHRGFREARRPGRGGTRAANDSVRLRTC